MTHAYSIEGDFQMGRKRQTFKIEVAADSEDAARERVYTQLGSRHGVTRREIRIDAVREVKGEDVRSGVVRRQAGQS